MFIHLNLKIAGKLIFTFNQTNGGHSNYVYSLATLENNYLASGDKDGKIKIWDITVGKLKYTFDQSKGGHKDWVVSLLSLENGYLASASLDTTVKIWDVTNSERS